MGRESTINLTSWEMSKNKGLGKGVEAGTSILMDKPVNERRYSRHAR